MHEICGGFVAHQTWLSSNPAFPKRHKVNLNSQDRKMRFLLPEITKIRRMALGRNVLLVENANVHLFIRLFVAKRKIGIHEKCRCIFLHKQFAKGPDNRLLDQRVNGIRQKAVTGVQIASYRYPAKSSYRFRYIPSINHNREPIVDLF